MKTTIRARFHAVVRACISRYEGEIDSIFRKYPAFGMFPPVGFFLYTFNGDSQRFHKLQRRIEWMKRICPNAPHHPSGCSGAEPR
jgi:hypothetical protein